MKHILLAAGALMALTATSVFAAPKAATKPAMKSGALTQTDRQWLHDAGEGELKEITIGKMVAKRASHPSVRQFAQRMVSDHSKANAQLKKLAASKGVTLPSDMGDKNEKTYKHLASLSSARLSRDYMMNMVVDHVGDINEFRKEAAHGSDREVKAFAAQTVPVLQHHLAMARNTAHAIGATHVNSKKPKA